MIKFPNTVTTASGEVRITEQEFPSDTLLWDEEFTLFVGELELIEALADADLTVES